MWATKTVQKYDSYLKELTINAREKTYTPNLPEWVKVPYK